MTHEELLKRFRGCGHPGEKLRLQGVLLKLEGRTTTDVADICKCRVDWVCRTVRKYNAGGPEALADQRGGAFSAVLGVEDKEELRRVVLEEEPPGGGLWTGKKVAKWIHERSGVEVTAQTGLNYLHSLGFSRQTPRPRHPAADQEAQEHFKKGAWKLRSAG